MFIQTEATPNPNALKFLPDSDVSPSGPVFFDTRSDAVNKSNLAMSIFDIDDVVSVFFGIDFITVTKDDKVDWEVLKPTILTTIMDYIVSGKPIFSEISESQPVNTENMSDIEKQIVDIIETRVRQSVAMDGGDIVYERFQDGVVYLQLRGACAGCPSAATTLKNGIESMLQHFVPEVKRVESVEKL